MITLVPPFSTSQPHPLTNTHPIHHLLYPSNKILLYHYSTVIKIRLIPTIKISKIKCKSNSVPRLLKHTRASIIVKDNRIRADLVSR